MTGRLAATTDRDAPGLPRGRTSLPADVVRSAQRERLVRAVIAMAAAEGYAGLTIGGIVQRARVSRSAFYSHFDSREACFRAAVTEGAEVMFGRIAAAADAAPSGVARLRAGLRAYLEFLVAEPEFARVFLVEILAGGLDLQRGAHERFAALNRRWHERHGGPAASPEAYAATVGVVHELVFARVRDGRTSSVLELEDALVAFVLAVLRAA
jgi:AcrR family transcriptional regulator